MHTPNLGFLVPALNVTSTFHILYPHTIDSNIYLINFIYYPVMLKKGRQKTENGGNCVMNITREQAEAEEAAKVSPQLMEALDQQVELKNALLGSSTSRRFQATVLGLATLQKLNRDRRS
jgi:hypothetical protein